MEVLEQLLSYGYQVFLDGENIKYHKKEDISPDPDEIQLLLHKLQDHKNEAIEFLKTQQNEKENSLVVFSKVLNREIVISWHDDSQKVVFVDQMPYTAQEIQRLKDRRIKPQELRTIHRLKETFEGQIQ